MNKLHTSVNNQIVNTHTVASPLGPIRIDASDSAIHGMWFVGQKWEHDQAAQSIQRSNALIEAAAKQLAQYFALTRMIFDLPLAPIGTVFQKAVWHEISRIAFGHHTSYGAIAHDLVKPKASRAVGAATGRNPISIVIPCHRVLGGHSVGSKQVLTGYAGGLDRKRWLLDHEQKLTRLL